MVDHDDDDCERMTPSRRAVLGAAGALFAWSFVPKFAYAAAGSRDPRFLLVKMCIRDSAEPGTGSLEFE